ncbi:GH36-type glycosyl hydrolase domain-containing protein [Rubrivirga sp. IMCC43871]|uniref:GH36-type glycosyl hydrolase domain-containing protein n=1 Tax=Rubrivirga sp. IMCC43871 TaxID=3391575 RepID=UPI00398FFE80
MPGPTVESLFKPVHLAEHARRLARTQAVEQEPSRGRPLRPLLREALGDLADAYRVLAAAGKAGETLTPATEWLLDNYHIIRDQARDAETAVPRAYYRVLPKLTAGPYQGLPRIYEIVESLAEHADNGVDPEHLELFVAGYQEVELLTLAELWALPMMLRVVLAQRVAALARPLREARREREGAEAVASRLAALDGPDEVGSYLATVARERAPLSGPFALALAAAVQARGGHTMAMEWVEHRLRARRLSLDDVEHIQTQRETQWRGSIANAVGALRAAAETDWRAIVERLSAVEQTLREDPAGVYATMDEGTRDAYRHVTERIARRSPETEFGVAERAMALAREAAEAGPDPDGAATDHVGYWLVGPGARRLGKAAGYHARPSRRLYWLAERHPTVVYLGGIALVTALGLLAAVRVADAGGADAGWLALTVAAAFLPLLDFAVTFVNWNVVRFLPPRQLPRLAYEAGIPSEVRTFVVVPTLITSPAHAREMVERLEVHALANPDAALRYALLTDWADAPAKRVPGDDATVEAARGAIRRLNERSRAARAQGDGADLGDRFFLLHRERLWNEAQGVWMGWERKRGKLEEFNDLLRDPDAKTTYVVVEGDFRTATEGDAVRYVLTLDADTRTTPDGARALVATAAHPLNRPHGSPEKGRVTRGYGVLQPRVSISPESGRQTLFARVYAGRPGVDPYTTAVSDAYQDLFGEGIYTGKGLYDVDAFRRTLDGAVRENSVLSHDLLEGNHARAALATGVEVFDDFPSRYASFALRQHRWVRGDWQLLPWLMPRVKDARGTWKKNPLSVVGRWKLFDNLRRSLTPPALLAFLLLAWTVLPGSPFVWTLIALFVLAFPIYAPAAHGVLFQPPDTVTSSWLRVLWADAVMHARQIGLSVAFLAHQSVVMLDAIVRTLWRMSVSKTNLLEWTTAQQAEESTRDVPHSMWASVGWGALVLASVTLAEPIAWITALPFAAAWIAAPWIARSISQPIEREDYRLTADDRVRLRTIARRTWRFFEEVLTERDRWLPPDNLQIQPAQGLARRTSPTNIGLALNAVQAARDLGYLTRTDEVGRVEAMLASVETLERYQGHLYNWYSTETGDVMAPRYVSTVDSGNLAGALIALKQGLLEVTEARWPGARLLDGFRDTLAEVSVATGPAREAREAVARVLAERAPTGVAGWYGRIAEVARLGAALAEASAGEPEATREWAAAFAAQGRAYADEMATLAPWLTVDVLPSAVAADLDAATTLGGLAVRVGLALDGDLGADARATLGRSRDALAALVDAARALADRADRLVGEMDFRPLYDTDRQLFRIGYDAGMARQDSYTYDLLASEARLASLLAVAKGEAPPEHWFHLSRPTRVTGVRRALLSWSGTMFEYLMPAIYTRLYERTLLYDACYNAVSLQRMYGRAKDRPWGISESGYALLDLHLTYQYRAFGVPYLGLKRGLGDDYVVSPYSTLLALMVRPDRALSNLAKLDDAGAFGPLGYYEAIDYTPSRTSGEPSSLVRSYMAHHQGMGLLAVANALDGGRFQDRFHRDPLVRSVEILLQERVPTVVEKIDPHPLDENEVDPVEIAPVEARVEHFPGGGVGEPAPHAALLSNGRYATLLTTSGTGYSRAEGVALTRWHGDRTRDADGLFIYVRDVESGRYWSAAAQPVPSAEPPDRYDVWVHLNKVETARVDDWIETFTEVVVSPEDNAEVRRVTVTNYGDRPRTVELTSYAEVVLQSPVADLGHPAFSKLFVETEYLPKNNALLATRRPRAEDDVRRWLVHAVADKGLARADRAVTTPLQYETDRMRFVGRGRTLDAPAAMDAGTKLSRTAGAVLDPVVSLRRIVTLQPKESARVVFSLAIADSREEAERLAERYDHPDAAQRAFELASTYGLVELGHLGLTGEEALNAQELAGRLLYADPRLASPVALRARNVRPQSGLWAYGVSGDLPIVAFRIARMEQLDAFRLLLRMHAFWRRRGLEVDLVVLNDHPPSYADSLQEALTQAVEGSPVRGLLGQRGGVFLRRADGMPDEDLTLFLSAARAVFDGEVPMLLESSGPEGEGGTDPALISMVEIEADLGRPERRPPTAVPAMHAEAAGRLAHSGTTADVPTRVGEPLRFDNGYGGFTDDGREYVIRQTGGDADTRTPLPWINVVANPAVGFTATESGEGYTWARNSQQNKLTPWSNDPVTDPAGEAIYLRDDAAGVFWTPTPRPAPAPTPYETRHGWGATSWTAEWGGLQTETTAFVPRRDPVKLVRLRITNTSEAPRQLSLYRYAELVLGERREPNAPYVIVERDAESGAVLAHNPYNQTYGQRLAFVAVAGAEVASVSASRAAFLGRNGHASAPAAVASGGPLDGSLDTGLDPCAAVHVPLALAPGEMREVVFLLGQAKTVADVRTLVTRYATTEAADLALSQVTAFWEETLGAVQVETPAPDLDVLVNGWLLYQNLSCRLWGRSAFYQSGGAYGFRDQLQDSLALIYARPDLTRAQILKNAAHQFEEGDVLHWWHPITGAGIRTRFSDDLLWLPYAVAFTLETTGDETLLDEEAPFLAARALEPGEDEVFLTPQPSGESGSIYEHAARAIDISLTAGRHGIPLMGSGDWNDGMNRVGNEGEGESVWLGFFLAHILERFIPIAEGRGDRQRTARYQTYRDALVRALNADGWDGKWYRRAFYDDGTPLGSAQNDECRIDAIAQGWSILSGVAGDRTDQVLDAVDQYLVDERAGLVRLLTPAFDVTDHDPGYIKGYLPGVRENGGQYTHGVLWAVRAFAEGGRPNRATDLLRMLLPVNHARTQGAADVYKTEPFAVAADVYSVEPHVGRGGWTWYTGSAGWMWRVSVETVLGLRREAEALCLTPRVPDDWPGYVLRYRTDARGTVYVVHVVRDGLGGATSAEVDGEAAPVVKGTARIPLVSDGEPHAVTVRLGEGSG